MNKKIKIQKVSSWSIGITIVLSVLFIIISVWGQKEFHIVQVTTDRYILCENAAKQLQDGSDYLTEQVRLYAMTGEDKYMNLYFQEANTTKRREKSIDRLKKYFNKTEAFSSLQAAMSCSKNLMTTEYYAMRLTAEAMGKAENTWPKEVQAVNLSNADRAKTDREKLEKAQKIVCDEQYQSARTEITNDVSECMNDLIQQTKNRQGRATTIFSDMYLKLEVGLVALVALMLVICMMVRKLIVTPLLSYNESIQRGEIFPVIGASELQNLAETYNRVYKENQETQKLIRHEAEHDALTDLLNRGSFEKVLHIYEKGEAPFAMILVDVDTFKSVNDTYGHATGDAILQKVATLLKNTFRSGDFVCRIGGDEFAVIMVDVTDDLQYTVKEKIDRINKRLAKQEGELPAVSLSVGVAFSDRKNPSDSIYRDADKALYVIKENGKNGCGFY